MAIETYLSWWAAEKGALPTAEADPWTATGAGGTLTAKGVRLQATAARNTYDRDVVPSDVDPRAPRGTDRIEVQMRFKGATGTPAWAASSPHALYIDDGERFLGVAIGDKLELITQDGTVLREVLAVNAWLMSGEYRLVKRGTTAWDLYVGGKRLISYPYNGAALSTATIPTLGYGCLDPAGTGDGVWNETETSLNLSLAPLWKIDRFRNSSPAYIQQKWCREWRGIAAAIIGVHQGAQDALTEAWDDFTAAMKTVDEGAFTGERSVALDGWTEEPDDTAFSVVRERIHLEPGETPVSARYEFDPPQYQNVAYMARATFTLREGSTTGDPNGRMGPFLRVDTAAGLNGRRLAAIMVANPGNPLEAAWVLTDAELAGDAAVDLGTTGSVRWIVDPYEPHEVELWIIGTNDGAIEFGDDATLVVGHVILVVDGYVVEYLPQDHFGGMSLGTPLAEAGRDGSTQISAIVEIEAGFAAIYVADNNARPWFIQHVAEHLLFASGCERNDELSALLWNLDGVTKLRGSVVGVTNEIRRLACDDDLVVIDESESADWYLEVSWPDITPVFLEANGVVSRLIFEVDPHAPNFEVEDLLDLLRTYILPIRTVEADLQVLACTLLTTDATDLGTESEFEVEHPEMFAAGDEVQLRHEDTGAALQIAYDMAGDLAVIGIFGVRNWADAANPGQLLSAGDSGPDNDYSDLWNVTGIIRNTNPGVAGNSSRIRVNSMPTMAGGMTVGGWIQWEAGSGSTRYWAATESPTTTGGFRFGRNSSGQIVATLWSGAGVLVAQKLSVAQPYADGTWVHVALVYDPTAVGAELTVFADGVQLGAAVATAAAANRASGGVAFGAEWTPGTSYMHSHADWWLFTRALTGLAVAALASGSRIDAPRDLDDANVAVVLFPRGYSGMEDVTTGTPGRAEYARVGVLDGRGWGEWLSRHDGQKRAAISGAVVLATLAAEKTANTVGGHTVTISSSSVFGLGKAWIYGVEQGTGNPLREELVLNGTANIVGTKVYAANGVHGIELEEAQIAGTVTVKDTTTATTLYTVTVGDTTRGIYVFDPPLPAGQVELRLAYSGVGTPISVVYGWQELEALGGEAVTLAAAGTVETGEAYDAVRVVSASYLPALATLTIDAVLTDPTGTLRLVSDDVGDTMAAWAFYVDTAGDLHRVEVALDGTTPVDVGTDVWRVLGILLLDDPVGTVTVTTEDGVILVTHGTIAGTREWGVVQRTHAADGTVDATLSYTPASPQHAAVFGLDAAGVAMAALLTYTDPDAYRRSLESFSLIQGFVVGGLLETSWITFRGVAWRHHGYLGISSGLVDATGWTATDLGTGSLVVMLDDRAPVDATGFAMFAGFPSLEGRWETIEDAEIVSITGSVVRTTELLETFVTGDTMRQRRE